MLVNCNFLLQRVKYGRNMLNMTKLYYRYSMNVREDEILDMIKIESDLNGVILRQSSVTEENADGYV